MRFTTAWANTASQNVTLKLTIAVLSMSLMSTVVALVRTSLRDPIIIERACYSRTLPHASTEHPQTEIRAFLEEALAQRFNSDAQIKPGYLSADEEGFRKQEQENLKASQMTQKIVVNRVNVDEDTIHVDLDRLISVGNVRSAFMFPLVVALSSCPRSEGNPYGLQLLKTSQVKKEEQK